MPSRLVVSKSKIIAVMLYVITFLSFNIDYFPGFQYVKYAFIALIAIYLFLNYKSFITWQNFELNTLICLFIIYVIIASFLNIGTLSSRNCFLASIVFVAIFAEVFFFMQIMGKKNKMDTVLNLYYKLTLFWVIVIDFLNLFKDSLFQTYHSYIVGTKFEVSYLHMILLGLCFYRIKYDEYSKLKRRLVIILLSILSVLMAIRVNCITGLIGIIITLLLQVNVFNLQRLIIKPTIFVIALLLPIIFVLFYEVILSNNIIKNLIVSVFNRDLTLTGRAIIYKSLPDLLSGHYIFGYGYGSTYEICKLKIGYADTQNALLEWVMQIGIPGTFLMILIFCFVIKKNYKSRNTNTYPIVVLIFALLILGMVEITIGTFFFGLMALIYGCSIEQENYQRKVGKQI